MADGDVTIALADATEMMDEVWDLDVIPIDTRFGATAQHFSKEDQFLGGALHKKVLTTTFTGARASASLESDAPDAYEIGTTDIEIQAQEILRMKKELTQILADNSGQTFKKVAADCERDHFLSAYEAKEYGLIDDVIGNVKTK